MAHHERSIHKHVITHAEKGGLSASTAGEQYGVPTYTSREWLLKYRRDKQVGRRKGTGLWRVSSPAQDAALVPEAERNPFFGAGILKLLVAFLGKKTCLFQDLRQPVSPHGMLR
jgi:hypothetical protein